MEPYSCIQNILKIARVIFTTWRYNAYGNIRRFSSSSKGRPHHVPSTQPEEIRRGRVHRPWRRFLQAGTVNATWVANSRDTTDPIKRDTGRVEERRRLRLLLQSLSISNGDKNPSGSGQIVFEGNRDWLWWRHKSHFSSDRHTAWLTFPHFTRPSVNLTVTIRTKDLSNEDLLTLLSNWRRGSLPGCTQYVNYLRFK